MEVSGILLTAFTVENDKDDKLNNSEEDSSSLMETDQIDKNQNDFKSNS